MNTLRSILFVLILVVGTSTTVNAKLVKGADGVWREAVSETPSTAPPTSSSDQANSDPDIPANIKQKIEDTYQRKYPDNYSMQKTLVNDQIESYKYMQDYTHAAGVPQDIFEHIKKRYLGEHPYDFSMQKTLVHEQVEAYEFMDDYLRAPGVPQKKFNKFKKIYQDKYPYDFSMQKTLVQDQVQSYLEMNSN